MEVVPLGPGFAAELRGIDLIHAVSSERPIVRCGRLSKSIRSSSSANRRRVTAFSSAFRAPLGRSNARELACLLPACSSSAWAISDRKARQFRKPPPGADQ